jgi:Bacterial pre-peptidase C-terminal domain
METSVKSKFYRYYAIVLAIGFTNLIACNIISLAAPPIPGTKPLPKDIKAVYVPIKLPLNGEVKDVLSEKDIPTGEGGFARDYAIELQAGDRIAIDLISETFDTVIILLSPEGKNIGKNDDGPDGSSNSLLFTQIKDAGTYVVRVQGFGETSSGEFKLKVTKLRPQ